MFSKAICSRSVKTRFCKGRFYFSCNNMTAKNLLTVQEVNELADVDFIQRFGNLVEHCALFAAAACAERPFSSLNDINNAFSKFMDDLPLTGKEAVLRLYSDLAGRLAVSGQLTRESTNERKAAGLDQLTDDETDRMSKLTSEYKGKFGFPFVICSRMNKKEAILKGLESRLKNTREVEAIAGINEVKKIACLRLKDIVDESSTT